MRSQTSETNLGVDNVACKAHSYNDGARLGYSNPEPSFFFDYGRDCAAVDRNVLVDCHARLG